LTDLLIIAAFMRQHDWYGKSSWDANVLLDEVRYPIHTLEQPKNAPVVVNAFWKQNRMFTPAGGGVSIQAENAIDEMTDDEELARVRTANRPDKNATSWWWD
jgi:hypothetical protein